MPEKRSEISSLIWNETAYYKAPNFSNQLIKRLLEVLIQGNSDDHIASNKLHTTNFGRNDFEFLVHDDLDNEWNYQSVLYYKASFFFDEETVTESLPCEVCSCESNEPKTDSYDLIFADIPMGNERIVKPHLEKLQRYLSPNGLMLGIFGNLEQIKRLSRTGTLVEMGIYPSSVLQLPQGFLGTSTNIAPILVCFLKRDKFNLVCYLDYHEIDHVDNLDIFIERHKGQLLGEERFDKYVELAARDLDYLLNEVSQQRFVDEDNLYFGIFESLEHFPGFEFWKFITPLKEIDSDFTNYEKCYLDSVAKEFNLTRGEFQPKENAIYIPLIGTQNIIQELNSSRIKHQNLCQVILDREKVMPAYLVTYLNSAYGKMFWDAAISAKPGMIKRLIKKDIQKLVVSLPYLDKQREIAEISTKIENAMSELENIKNSLALNPISSERELQKLNSIMDSISEVSPLLCEESIIHEFKASLRTPFPTFPERQVNENGQSEYKLGKSAFKSIKQVQTFLESIVLKSIASFLNTRGGTLVIGVHERGNNKEVVGIDRENFESHDHYERHLIQILKNNFGAVVVSKYVSTKITQIDGISVCVVTCEPYLEDELVYLDDKVFVRTGPRIDQLTTQQVVELVKLKTR